MFVSTADQLRKKMQNKFFKLKIILFLIPGAVWSQQPSQPDNSQKLSSVQGGSLTDQLTELQQKNKYSQVKYSLAAVQLAQEAARKFEHGGECQASCPVGCCDSGEGLIYEGGLFMLLNTQAKTQAKTNQIAALKACGVYNKIAMQAKDCNAEVKPFDLTVPEKNWYDDKGKCKSSAPPECKMISLLPGSSIFTKKGVNCIRSADNPCTQDFYSTFKTNPDGSVSIKTDKKTVRLTFESFADKKSLLATGIPIDFADQLLKEFKMAEKNNKLDTINEPALVKQLNEELNKAQSPQQEAEVLKKQSVKINLDGFISDESLTINYNGEPIHISKGNIFKIITNRYKKTTSSLLSEE